MTGTVTASTMSASRRTISSGVIRPISGTPVERAMAPPLAYTAGNPACSTRRAESPSNAPGATTMVPSPSMDLNFVVARTVKSPKNDGREKGSLISPVMFPDNRWIEAKATINIARPHRRALRGEMTRWLCWPCWRRHEAEKLCRTCAAQHRLLGGRREPGVKSLRVCGMLEAISNESVAVGDFSMQIERTGAMFKELNDFLLNPVGEAFKRRNEIDTVFPSHLPSPFLIAKPPHSTAPNVCRECSLFVLISQRSIG